LRPWVKIGGLTRPEDIAAVNGALPDYIGFVFAPSRLQIDERAADTLKERLDGRIKAAGVFVNQNIETIADLYRRGVIDVVQLHGDEHDGYITRLKEDCGCPVIKAIGIGDSLPPLPRCADYLLFDTLSEQRGAAGKAFDWGMLKGYDGPPYFLAGGLNAINVPDAVRLLSPYCVDVSSGVETDGIKNAGKIHKFVRIVRNIEYLPNT
jgi:phosphoribosylanthranilate isomerase